MIGGAYLCFEGAEKVLHSLQKNKTTLAEDVAVVADQDHEEAMVKGAVRTDFILSAEIMVIALNEVLDEHFAMRAATLAVVAIAITIAVRSEEHTSELQSLMRISYAVFCLQKKTTIHNTH